MELHDRNCSKHIRNPNDSDEYMAATVNSNESKMPIHSDSMGQFGASTDIHADPTAESMKGQGIVLTREVDQSVSRF